MLLDIEDKYTKKDYIAFKFKHPLYKLHNAYSAYYTIDYSPLFINSKVWNFLKGW